MKEAVVSVVITTFRRLELLRETIQSVVSQTLNGIEVIVIDDAGEFEVSAAIQAMDRGSQTIRYVARAEHLERSGCQPSRNLGWRLSGGDYLLFLDDDDLLSPTCIEGRLSVLKEEPDAGFCVGQCALFDGMPKSSDPLWQEWADGQDDLWMFLSNRVPWQTSGPLWRREAVDRAGPWDEDLQSGFDYEFHIRALAKGAVGRRLPVVDYHWRRPRADSYSGFDAFKRQHRDGHHVLPFCKAIDAVGDNGQWTPPRRAAAWREAIRLAAQCRLNGGSRPTAQSALDRAYRWGCAPISAYAEATACIAAWGRFSGKIPSLAYMNRRGLLDA